MVAFENPEWNFLWRAFSRWINASIAVGVGAGITASGFIFGVIASPSDGAVHSLALWFVFLGPGLLIVGAITWGLLAGQVKRKAKAVIARRGGQATSEANP